MNDETDVTAPVKQDATGKTFAQVAFSVGAVIRLVIIGFGCAALSHMLTGTFGGPRYWIGSLTIAAVYLLGAIMEHAGDYSLKKERK